MRSLSLACIALAACEPAATEIIVSTDTDYEVGSAMWDINVIRYEVTLGTGMPRVAERMIDRREELPVTLGIVAPSDVSDSVTIRASGLRRDGGDGVVVEVTREAWFREGESLVLPLFLLRECNRPPCTSTDGCDESGCASREAPDLAPWSGSAPALPPCSGACCHTCLDADGRCGEGDASECGRGGGPCAACVGGDECRDGVCTGFRFDEVRVFDRGFGLAVTDDGRVREVDTMAFTHAEVLELPAGERFEHAAPGRYEEGRYVRFGCAVAESGGVWCWTPPDQTEAASTTWAPLGSAMQIVLPEPAHRIATARSVACALGRDSGQVYCWGQNNNLVRPSDGLPQVVPIIRGARDLVGSHVAFCALAEEALCWGGSPGLPEPLPPDTEHVPRGLGNFAELAWGENAPSPRFCGRTAGASRISCWTRWGTTQPLDFPQVVESLGVGSEHACAITSDGHLHCGALPPTEPMSTQVNAGAQEFWTPGGISSFQGTTCAIDAGRRLWCFSTAFEPTIVRPEAL